MLELLSDPAVWASFLTLAVLEIVLGVDNVIFLSIVSARLPEESRARARFIGLMLALVMRVLLLLSIAWIIGLTEPFVTILGFELSWRDVILIGGGLFLIYKGANEIFQDVEGTSAPITARAQSSRHPSRRSSRRSWCSTSSSRSTASSRPWASPTMSRSWWPPSSWPSS